MFVFDFSFDFDELTEPFDGVQRDGVPIELEPFARLLDGRGRLEVELSEDTIHRLTIIDCRLELLAGFRG